MEGSYVTAVMKDWFWPRRKFCHLHFGIHKGCRTCERIELHNQALDNCWKVVEEWLTKIDKDELHKKYEYEYPIKTRVDIAQSIAFHKGIDVVFDALIAIRTGRGLEER